MSDAEIDSNTVRMNIVKRADSELQSYDLARFVAMR